jgi:hypothetical protein
MVGAAMKATAKVAKGESQEHAATGANAIATGHTH